MVSDDDISVRNINRLCEAIGLLKERDFEAATTMAERQIRYVNPLKPQQTQYYNELGEYNKNVIAALRTFQTVIKSKK